jgi:hypothetical protein
MSLLPFGGADQYLLYHVDYGVIARDKAPFVNLQWLDPETSP